MPVQANGHAEDDANDPDDGGQGQGRVAAIDEKAKEDGHEDKQNGNDGRGGIGCRGLQIHRAAGIEGGIEGVGHDGGKSRHYQNEGKVGEDDEQLFGPGADGIGDDLTDGFTLVADRGEQGAKVVDASKENAADKNPQHHRHPTKNGGLDGAIDGAGTGNGGKVVSHKHGSLGGTVVLAVLQLMGGGRAAVFNAPLFGQPSAVEDVAEQQNNDAPNEEQCCVHDRKFSFLFASLKFS